VGGQGADLILGNEANDTIYGNEANDTIFGGAGDDLIIGGQGNDILYGNEGNDTIFGNEGADRFIFAAGSGNDKIADFSFADGDRLDLQGQSYTTGTGAGGDVLLTLSGGGTILLSGVNTFQGGFVA
jgi:Ca2+-binding RTX toxin-like protein